MEALIPLNNKMVSTHSTEVDAITGATASSKDLIEAVNEAIRKASEN
ncbi:MAG: FMN-binding protein [Candidatus Omnitrophica bacterium]|nr:FMN-binding protein [Candidatus Omnitrophota bacterium]